MCLYPTIIQNKKYTATKKNGGVIPSVRDNRVLAIPIGCGRCMECKNQERMKWQVRLTEDIKKHINGKFVTLTFSNKSIKDLTIEILEKNKNLPKEKKISGYKLDNAIATLAVERFRERWRKKYKKSIRHWLVTELGHKGTENIHMHGIVWTDENIEEVEKHWKYGTLWKGNEIKKGVYENYVNEATVNYTTKYVSKTDPDHKYYKPKILTSSGIGGNYEDRMKIKHEFKGEDTNETYRTKTGVKLGLPIYYRNKVFTEDEREKLWLHKLDKNIRYVGGEKIDVSEGMEEYYKILEYYRKKNIRLGYGEYKIDWDRKKYEEQRRLLMQQKRINGEKSCLWEDNDKSSKESAGKTLHSTSVSASLPKWDYDSKTSVIDIQPDEKELEKRLKNL